MAIKKDAKLDLAPKTEHRINRTPASSHRKGLRSSLFFSMAVFILVLAFISNAYRFQIYNELNYLKLTPQTEKFTELYFENSSNLPRVSKEGETMFFSFTIDNLEGKDKQYHYSVCLKNESGMTLIDDNTASIKSGESRTINETYTFPVSYPKEILFVELPELNQEIHFFLANNNQ
jgi:hypothetical protein